MYAPTRFRQSETAISQSTWSHGLLDFTSPHSRSVHKEHAGATGGGGVGGCGVGAAARRAGFHLLGGACFYDLDRA
eukprot:5879282-Prymnesium_polylepis.1